VITPGYPQPGFDPNAHLPSSSRGTTDTSHSTDTFDLNRGAEGPSSVKGSASGAFVSEGVSVPEAHSVRRGDTLWDISGRYYNNPYNWPRLWAYNPQIQNPHWIYPGDRVRLREGGGAGGTGAVSGGTGFGGRGGRGGGVPPNTVFLRDVGWLDDRKEDTWGELVGSPDDQMLLSDGDDVYIALGEGHDVQIGQELTIFRPLITSTVDGSKGQLVSIRGTARVDRYNPKTRMVRAHLVESVDVIERGARVGPVGRRFDVVPPVVADRDIEARILASIYPHVYYGQHQVVFLDKGEQDGLKPGYRFFAVRRGDRWADSLGSAGQMARYRPRVEDDRPAKVDPHELNGDEELYPDETYGELRVLRVRARTATAVVVVSLHEIERTARLIAKKGF
jgi:hypothetical protein